MPLLASEVMDLARKVYLNDPTAGRFPDTELLPYLKEALNYLQGKYLENELDAMVEESLVISVPAGITDLSALVNYPTDLVSVIEVLERLPGQDNYSWLLMTEVNTVSNVAPRDYLFNWTFNTKIEVTPATRTIEVFIRYYKLFSAVSGANTAVAWPHVLGFLAARTAAIAAGFGGGSPSRGSALGAISEDYLAMAINVEVHAMQNEPVRHRPYNFGRT